MNLNEIGNCINKIGLRLSKSQTIYKLLKISGDNALETEDVDLSLEENNLIKTNILNIPKINSDFITDGKIVIINYYGTTDAGNLDYELITFRIDIIMPFDMWEIKGGVPRPYLLMSEINKILNKQEISSIGTMKFLSYELDVLDEKIFKFSMDYTVNGKI